MKWKNLQMPKNVEVDDKVSTNRYGKFSIEPLERGFGVTLANALRRALLSSLPGAAVTAVKIDGVQHEFTTMTGIKEDVPEILINIKGMRFKIHSEGPKTATFESHSSSPSRLRMRAAIAWKRPSSTAGCTACSNCTPSTWTSVPTPRFATRENKLASESPARSLDAAAFSQNDTMRSPQRAVNPASTVITLPVTRLASSEASHTAAAAMSDGSINSFMGWD